MKTCLLCEGISTTEQQACSACGAPLLQTTEVHYPLRRGEEDAANPLLGALIDGKYRITGVLGKGGMGSVFRAVHEVSLVPVALKILHPRFAARADLRTYFLAEARKAGRVVHEHSARIQDVGEAEDGTVYIAMELISGATLHDWIWAERPMPPALLVDVLRQIAQALAAAHAVGLVHRDLSPRNVMVTVRDGRPFVKILDFGIARGAPPPVAERFAAPADGHGAPAGFANPPYSAPEHLAGSDVDARADLYGIGVIAYEALARRWPCGGDSGAELARATIEGRIEPLPRLPGVPRRLRRLVHRLLALAPEQRPPDAAAVIAELDAIARPRAARLRPVATATLVGAALLFTAAYAGSEPAFLRHRPGSPLVLATQPEGLGQEPLELQSARLQRVPFDFGGFDPRLLAVEAWQGEQSVPMPPLPIEPGPRSDQLWLHAGDPRHSAFVDVLRQRSRHGPIHLKFVAGRHPPLGYVRLLVDDEAPRPRLQVSASHGEASGPTTSPRDVLNRDSRLEFAVEDPVGTLHAVELIVHPTDGRPETVLPLDGGAIIALRRGAYVVAAADLLGEVFPQVGDAGPVELRLQAKDRAENVGTSAPLRVAHVDFRLPNITKVTSRRGVGQVVTWRRDGAALRVDLDDVGEPLTLLVRRPGGDLTPCESQRLGRGLGLVLPPLPVANAGEPPFADGTYEFVLRDAAGNVSAEPFREELRFQSEDLAPQLSVEHGEAVRSAMIGNELLLGSTPAALAFRCNALYKPIAASLTPLVPLPSHAPGALEERRDEPALRAVAPGTARVELGALRDGVYELAIEVAEAPLPQASGGPESNDGVPAATDGEVGAAAARAHPVGEGELGPVGGGAAGVAHRVAWRLRVLQAAVTLEVPMPPPPQARFLAGFVEELALLEDGPGRVRQGSGWRLEPLDWRLVQGRVWTGAPGNLVASPLPSADRDSGPLLGPIALRRGENVIALELQDVLGRPVRVTSGGRPAPEVPIVPAAPRDPGERRGLRAATRGTARQIARFHWHDGAPELPPEVRVEFGQHARLSMTVPLPFVREDRIELRIDASPITPLRVRSAPDGGAELDFLLPFERLQLAAPGLSQLEQAQFAEGHRFTLNAKLKTPADEHALTLVLRTIRSELKPVRLEELAALPAVPPALAAIAMVPVLGPNRGESWRDPVLDDETRISRRNEFRPLPPLEVRNVRDCYLQRAEMTRGEYAAAIAAFDATPAAGRPSWQSLVHAADPLGENRLLLVNLVPAALRGRSGEWRRLVAAAPDRPVSGVDFFQAFTVAGIVSWLVTGEPRLLRLPLGLELELAALGARPEPLLLNGASRRPPGMSRAAHVRASSMMADLTRWPPTAAEAVRAGDVVRTELGGADGGDGSDLVGLDFGVREWVLDLPVLATDSSRRLLLEWLADHERHLQTALWFASAAGHGQEPSPHLAVIGVVRGVATGERLHLVDVVAAAAKEPFTSSEAAGTSDTLTRGVPGVTRVLFLRRDGASMLPDEHDPHLRLIGMRLAGGDEFVRRVRGR